MGIITSSPALGSIVAMMLEDEEQLHVEQFDDVSMLMAHMRIVPLDLIVMDYHLERITAAQMVLDLRRSPAHGKFQSLVLTSIISAEIKLACKFARIDEVIIKPMSPVFLKERVLWRLQIQHFVKDALKDQNAVDFSLPPQKSDAQSGQRASWPENVVPLFNQPRPWPDQPRPF